MKYLIKTFGCQQNHADSERIARAFKTRKFTRASTYDDANYVIINSCMVRESAENRVYGLVDNLGKLKEEKLKKGETFKIIVTGCMVGIAFRDTTGKYLKRLKSIMPQVDEFMPIDEIGFNHDPIRTNKTHAWISISNGCNNFCTFCIVPFTRGREISRPYDEIIKEAKDLKKKGYKEIMLLGQNVNSYGSDLINNSKMKSNKSKNKPIFVKHLGRYRIPTLFPYLLEEVAKIGFKTVRFISSNPWDFSDELISVITKNPNISRLIHLPVQSGSNSVLKRMNRWYTKEEFLNLISKLKFQIPGVKFTTDIIVGFCGETDAEFQETVDLCKKVDFQQAFISQYSPRFNTAATKVMKDDTSYPEKEKRWLILEKLINKPHLKKQSL